jgi:hypothetical protein
MGLLVVIKYAPSLLSEGIVEFNPHLWTAQLLRVRSSEFGVALMKLACRLQSIYLQEVFAPESELRTPNPEL